MICQRTFCAVILLCVSIAAAEEPTLLGDWRFDEAGGEIVRDAGGSELHGRLIE